MRLLSVDVGLPREVSWRGRPVRTAIWKEAVDGPRFVSRLNFVILTLRSLPQRVQIG